MRFYLDEADIVTLNKPYEEGKKSKKLKVEHHFNSQGITLKKLIPLLESYSESIEHFDHKVKLTVEFIEVERWLFLIDSLSIIKNGNKT